jgi:hypothetical protein
MAQAESITTAIRELMSGGRPDQSTSPVRLAHTEFVAAVAGNVPHPIYADVDSDDLDDRADHLEKVFAALHVYLTAIIADTARNVLGGTLDRRYLDTLVAGLVERCAVRDPQKCASTRIGGRHDPPVRDRTDFSQTS